MMCPPALQSRFARFVAATRAFGYLLTLVLQLPPDCHCAAHKAYLLLRRIAAK